MASERGHHYLLLLLRNIYSALVTMSSPEVVFVLFALPKDRRVESLMRVENFDMQMQDGVINRIALTYNCTAHACNHTTIAEEVQAIEILS